MGIPKSDSEKISNLIQDSISSQLVWLEEDSVAVQSWLEKREAERKSYFNDNPFQAAVHATLTALWKRKRVGLPFEYDRHFYFIANSGNQEKPVLWKCRSPYKEAEIVLDPNHWEMNEALANFSVSPSEESLVYAISENGSDWVRWYLYDLVKRETLPLCLHQTRGENITWTPNSDGFFYIRYVSPKSGPQIWFHSIHPAQPDNRLLMDGSNRWQILTTEMIDREHLLVISKQKDENRTLLHYRSQDSSWECPSQTIERKGTNLQFLGNIHGSAFWLERNNTFASVQVASIDNWLGPWKTIVTGNILAGRLMDEKLLLVVAESGFHEVRVYSTSGIFLEQVPLPNGGSIGLLGKQESRIAYFQYRSFCQPATNYAYHLTHKSLEIIHESLPAVDLSELKTERIQYPSHDGTSIPAYLSYKDTLAGNRRPVLIYGYGGHGTSVWPSFSLSILIWVLMGGIYMVPSVRGGGELGVHWHRDGQKRKKWNSILDFVFAAKWLSSQPFADASRIVAMGSSAGGFLVANAITAAPDAFRAAVINAGLMDMLRYEKLGHGHAWTNEYGSMNNPDEANDLKQFSPLENVRPDTKYPSVLLYTGLSDDRVHPSHSYKFCEQLLRNKAKCILQSVSSSGHAAGLLPTSKKITRLAEQLAFIFHETEMNANTLQRLLDRNEK